MEDDLIFFISLNEEPPIKPPIKPPKKTPQKYIKHVSDKLFVHNKLERTQSCNDFTFKTNKIVHLNSAGILMAKKRVKFEVKS